MRLLKIVLFSIILSLTVIACSEEPNLKTVEVEIEGMSCQMSCANLIQKKVAQIDGVSYANVSFEENKGIFTYDTKATSKEKILAKINNIADGKLYKVKSDKQIDQIISKK